MVCHLTQVEVGRGVKTLTLSVVNYVVFILSQIYKIQNYVQLHRASVF